MTHSTSSLDHRRPSRRRRHSCRSLGSRAAIVTCLFAFGLAPFVADAARADEPRPRFPAVDNETAWQLLPPSKVGERSGAMPVWARTMVRTLPTTTAALLELDHAQRKENPLDPQLRAAIRWVAARANGSRYAEQTALADWLRAGGNREDLEALIASPENRPANASAPPPAGATEGTPQVTAKVPSDKMKRVVRFARQMCEAAYEVRDEQVQKLLEDHGPSDLTAIVLTLAYANFQDRLLIALGLDAEDGGQPLEALKVTFDWEELKKNPVKAPPRETPPPPPDADQVPARVADEEWEIEQLDELKKLLETQKVRAPRIPIPPDEVVERNLPPGLYPPGVGPKIIWNGVGYGYQPKLTEAWFLAMRRFREDAGLPGDMRQSVFWVVTRSNWCFY